jgi:hypothetical protein
MCWKHRVDDMLLKVIAYYVGVLVVLLAGLAFGAVLLFFLQGTNIFSDPGDREFTKFYIFCVPFIAALIAIPNAIKKYKVK